MGEKFCLVILSLMLAQLFLLNISSAAPSSVSYAGQNGAYASAGDDNGGTIAMASPSGAQSGTIPTGMGSSGSAGGSSTLLLSRSGGSSSPSKSKMQSVVVGSNGDTTILQQNGNQPAKVYQIPASG